jgi:hypothetical protein
MPNTGVSTMKVDADGYVYAHTLEGFYRSIGPFAASVNHEVGKSAQGVLLHVYPIPVTSAMHIQWSVPKRDRIRISLLDVVGREVATVFDAETEAGDQEAFINATDLSAGMYEVWLRGGMVSQRARIVVTR